MDSINRIKDLNIWIEVTTLIIPGQNDSEDKLNRIAEFIAKVAKAIPWYISRFYPSYQFTTYHPTAIERLRKAKQIGGLTQSPTKYQKMFQQILLEHIQMNGKVLGIGWEQVV